MWWISFYPCKDRGNKDAITCKQGDIIRFLNHSVCFDETWDLKEVLIKHEKTTWQFLKDFSNKSKFLQLQQICNK